MNRTAKSSSIPIQQSAADRMIDEVTMEIANSSQFTPITDLRGLYPALGFSGLTRIRTTGEPLFVTDPIYLADVYNAADEPDARYLREKTVIVSDFGGDVAVPVWWKSPFLVMPTALGNPSDTPSDAIALASRIVCDSGSFVFIVLDKDVPVRLRGKIDKCEAEGGGSRLQVPAGVYDFQFEQLLPQSSSTNFPGLNRNIVALWTP